MSIEQMTAVAALIFGVGKRSLGAVWALSYG